MLKKSIKPYPIGKAPQSSAITGVHADLHGAFTIETLQSSPQYRPHIVVLTLFPEIYPGPLSVSLVGKALDRGTWKLSVVNMRQYGMGRYGTVDDTPYGGGAGMVIRPDIIDAAVQEGLAILKSHKQKADGPEEVRFIYMTPRGDILKQQHMQSWMEDHHDIIVLCGRYEGVDQRVLDHWQFQGICLGDFVLCGGDLPALCMIEGYIRILPDVIGNPLSLSCESFQIPLLEHPLYTRPHTWKGHEVPEVLLSGNHKNIEKWRMMQSHEWTQKKRPDLWSQFIKNK